MRERPYQKLIVWKEAHALCREIYAMTANFPQREIYALADQMRRSSYSVPMNIAEGNARKSNKDQAHFLEISISSHEELHYQCLLSRDLDYIHDEQLEQTDNHIQRVGYLLHKLRSSLAVS